MSLDEQLGSSVDLWLSALLRYYTPSKYRPTLVSTGAGLACLFSSLLHVILPLLEYSILFHSTPIHSLPISLIK